MGLVKVDSAIITSSTASATLTGINSTDPHMLVITNFTPVSDNVYLRFRVTASGSEVSTSNYDYAQMLFRSGTSFLDMGGANGDVVNLNNHSNGTSDGETVNAIAYLQNFNNANHYSSITLQETGRDTSGDDNGTIGGIIYTVAEAHDGVKLWWSSGNIAEGKAVLYRMVI